MKTNLHSRFSILATVLAALVALSSLHFQPACAQTADDFNPGANFPVVSLAVQADEKILVGGWFATLGGQSRSCIGRLNADGTVDTSFNPGPDALVFSLALQPDGKILVGGAFTTLGGQSRSRIGLLNADGTLDTSFNPGADSPVFSVALQADGKILAGGAFTTLGGQSRSCIGRLNGDGTVDTSFNPGANADVYSLALQADGKILVGGEFTTLGPQSRNYIGRLNGDGTLDTSFNPGAWGSVYCLALQADGKILVGGDFTTMGGQSRSCVGRLNADGTVDTTFNPAPGGEVDSLAVQADGKILVGGWFTTLAGQPRNYLGRLNADGTVDTTFNLGANANVYSLALQADGKILVGGAFTTVGGQSRNCIGRLNNTEPATQNLTFDGSAITWLRGGASPEVWRTTFDFSTNGTDWASLGAGARIPGGWHLTSVSLPSANGAIRARGYVSGGQYDASGWFVESDYGMPFFVSQPGNQTNDAGTTATFSVLAHGSAPLSYQWLKDGGPLADGGNIAGTGTAVLTLTHVLGADAGGYSVVVSNGFGSVTSTVAVLAVNLATLDSGFNPGASGQVGSLAVQADGKILVGGSFTTLGGQPRNAIGRLNADGTLDSGFNPGAGGSYPYVGPLAVQADGKILVGGDSTTLAGQPCHNIGRLNADGTLDSGFNPGAGLEMSAYVPSLYALAVQADGKILVGGWFTTLAGQTRNYLGRLNADGTVDSAFDPGADNEVDSLAVQSDGKILVGGEFSTLGGQTRGCLGRLNADGTLDASFNREANNRVDSLAVQADGKILVGGDFTTLGGQSRSCIGRLNADGTLDTSFNPGANGDVFALAVQADGKILVGGLFTTLGGQSRNYIGLLNADGTVDTSFNPGANGDVFALAVQADGKILVGGGFSTLDGEPCNYIGRLNNTEPATQSLSFDGSTITWLRGGASPEVWRTTFDYSTNGTDWPSLGAGTRIAGGWRLTSVSLPSANGTIRARGYVTGGDHNASSWFVESDLVSTYGPPVFISQPASRTNDPGTTATFSVVAGGPEPLGYQWRKDGVPLADGGNIAGAATAMLVLRNVLGGDAGGYSVVVSNGFGSVTSALATLVVMDPLIAVQPVSQLAQLGQTATLSVTAAGTAPFAFQWWKEGAMLPWGTGASLALTNLQATDAGDYSVVVSNQYGSVTSAVALLAVNGATLDSGFNPGADGTVCALALQADGKILVGGGFGTLGGQPRNCIGRVNADGTLDSGFNPGPGVETLWYVPVPYVYALAVQADGKILVGGYFTNLCGQARNSIGRLNADGTLDSAFNPGADGTVWALALQADGKILVGGYFTTLGGQTRNYIGRLNADGTVDSAFNPGAGYAAGYAPTVYSLAVQADGKILVGGYITTLGGQTRNAIGRLNADGTVDNGFNPGAGEDERVDSLALQADGKILVGGSFVKLGGQSRNCVGRLNADGTVDTSFNPGAGGADYGVVSLAVQADGKILVGGDFATLGGQSRSCIGRLNADGTLDTSFDVGAAGGAYPYVDSLALQADGKILVGGWFTTLCGQPRNYIGRLNNTEPATQSLSYDGSAITWLRGGASPEVWRTTFDYSTNGTDWASLGAGARIAGLPADQAGGWQLTSVSLPSANGTIRARGYVSAGQYDASGWFVESYYGMPVFVSQPGSQTNDAATTATFSVVAGGPEPLGYQWRKDGVPLADGGNIAGAATAMLVLANVLGGDAGGYSVVLSNGFGSVTSALATLAVIDPAIAVQPVSQIGQLGDSVTFSVTAVGTAPFGYHWCKDGAALAGGIGAFLTLTNLQAGDGGQYYVVVSNQYSSVTSAVALLAVNLATLDSGFSPGANNTVCALALQEDGKILVGGYFTTLGGQTRNYLGRLNADGTLDTGFNPGAGGGSYPYVGSLAVQADGKILVGGDFTTLGGQTRSYIGRLNADGTLDSAFTPGADSQVLSLALQADGKILVGGYFTRLGRQTRNQIGRLNADGTLDSGFNPGPNNAVGSLAVQADGKILVGGYFTTLGGQTRNYLGRLNADGTLDSGFNPGAGGSYPDVGSLAVQADGKILVGGEFTALGGLSRNYAGRLNADGTLDSGFNPGAGGNYPSVGPLAVQADGKILVGGYFTNLCGQPRNCLGRLNNTEPATQSLSFDGSTITWLRGGASPEVWRTTFEFSNDGANWASLGAGARFAGLPAGQAGGWQLTSVSLPSTNGTIRARGYLTTWFVETQLVASPPPVILVNDPSFGFSSNGFGFKFSGTAGLVVIVETSTNLATWTPAATNTLAATPSNFSDAYSGNFPQKFYRLRCITP